jgi:NAD(P)-dependent dehydrogenase (short-subunit alcohol dehydrogenase family)
MTRTLITGANHGLGYHTAQRLMALGHEVWVSARDAASGTGHLEGDIRRRSAAIIPDSFR